MAVYSASSARVSQQMGGISMLVEWELACYQTWNVALSQCVVDCVSVNCHAEFAAYFYCVFVGVMELDFEVTVSVGISDVAFFEETGGDYLLVLTSFNDCDVITISLSTGKVEKIRGEFSFQTASTVWGKKFCRIEKLKCVKFPPG